MNIPKKVLHINSYNSGSTGNIMLNISKIAKNTGFISYVAYANSRSNKKKHVENGVLIGSIWERNLHLKLAYYTGLNGCFSVLGTRKFLKKINEINPDIMHLHNLHNCYINLKMLFDYIKIKNIPVVWTLHDCWAFTGQCPHFTMVRCKKWKNNCCECPQYTEYPASKVDKTQKMYAFKKEWFTGVKNLTVVTPSHWLAELVGESFLNEYSIKVINNGIDLNTFKPRKSSFRKKHLLQNKFLVLGVAYPWTARKGLSIFVELSKRLDQSYKIVLVGLTDKQIRELPHNIVCLTRTNSEKELAEIYTAADVFVNATLEDNFPTTNLEAIACGTPLITFNTGGSPEAIDEKSGIVVEKGNVEQLIYAISKVRYNDKISYTEHCCERAQMLYEYAARYNDYLKLYRNILNLLF